MSAESARDAIRWNLPGAAIEAESFRLIGEEAADLRARLPDAEWRVARRLIHATGDMRVADSLVFRHDPVSAGLRALRSHAPVFCDTGMVRAGISLARLRRLHPDYGPDDLHCLIAHPDVAARAEAGGLTRALCAAEAARDILPGAVALVGNAPLALAGIVRLALEEGIRPALVVGMPVGFVNVREAKDYLAQCDVPHIVLEGRRGGGPLAVAALHAVMESADAGTGA